MERASHVTIYTIYVIICNITRYVTIKTESCYDSLSLSLSLSLSKFCINQLYVLN